MTQQLAINLEALRKAHWSHWAPEENSLVLWCVAALQEQGAPAASPTPAPLTDQQHAVLKAAEEWICERAPNDWSEAELYKAVCRLNGDWPGCDECDFKCDEPCMPATVEEMVRGVDLRLADLVHEGKLHGGDGYKPPEGWTAPAPKKHRQAFAP